MTIFQKILCPTDFSEASYRALDMASKLALHGDAEVCLMYVEPDLHHVMATGDLSPQDAAHQRAEAVRNLCSLIEERTPNHLRTSTLLLQGEAGAEIIKAAKEQQADLIVLTVHGGGETGEPVGDVAMAVLSQAPCPVLVLNFPRELHVSGAGTAIPRPGYHVAHSGSHTLYLDGD
jgi:nucleotide-binding universal stress UspA family protein